jgi:polyphosphate kinase
MRSSVPITGVMSVNLDELFPGLKVLEVCPFYVVRIAKIELTATLDDETIASELTPPCFLNTG